jgi:hypothetical protein
MLSAVCAMALTASRSRSMNSSAAYLPEGSLTASAHAALNQPSGPLSNASMGHSSEARTYMAASAALG